MMLDMAESVADGAWYSMGRWYQAGAAAAKTYLKTIGTAGDYEKFRWKSKNLKDGLNISHVAMVNVHKHVWN